MKLGCSSWSFHRTIAQGKMDQKSWIEKCAKELKLDGVELLDAHFPSTTRDYLKDLKKYIIELGLTISCVSVSNHFTTLDDNLRRQNVDKVKRWLDIAYFMGAPVLRIFAGAAKELQTTAIWNKVIGCLKECCRYAEDSGIVLGLENHGGFSADEVLRMFKETDSPWLKMTLDTGNFPSDPYGSIEKVADYAVFVHAKLYEAGADGVERKLDYEKIFPILKKRNYLGFLSIEFEGKEDELTFMPKGVNYLKRMIAKYACRSN